MAVPRISIGFRNIAPPNCSSLARNAVDSGFEAFDTAESYGNSEAVIRSIRKLRLARERLFVTTKLSIATIRAIGEGTSTRRIERVLRPTQRDYFDLVLLHWPEPGYWERAWDALCAARDRGLCNAVGVSNFGPSQLNLFHSRGLDLPRVNQIEIHPYFSNFASIKAAARARIPVQAYGIFGRGYIFKRMVLKALAAMADVTVAQLVLVWALSRFDAVVVGASAREHLMALEHAQRITLEPLILHRLDLLDLDHNLSWHYTEEAP